MRIVVDASCWANRRGFGRFTRCLVGEMVTLNPRAEYALVIDEPSLADVALPPLPSDVDIVAVPVSVAPAAAAGATSSRGIRDLARMSIAASRLRPDVFFFPASYSFFPVVGAPVVVTIHDAIAERLPDLTLPSRAARWRWWLKQKAALKQARTVITVSEASRQAIIEELRVPASRVAVIHEAPDSCFTRRDGGEVAGALGRLGLEAAAPYVLYVGGISPHKNLLVLIDAFESAAARHPELRLVLAGDPSDDPFLSSTDSVRRAAEESPHGDRIVFAGYVPDEELAALYSGAAATVLPSLGEGFGLPAAESAACGTPVIASSDPALMELLGDTGLYAEAADSEHFARHIDALVADPARRAALAASTEERARTWSWRTAAERTVDILTGAVRDG